MSACDPQLSEAQRVEGYQNQRTGVAQAIRPFQGTPTPENLAEYLNREVVPVLRQSRQRVNDVYLQVADNAPSGNPLGFYFSTETAAADPTAGRLRLDAVTQNTATTIRVSQSSGRLVDVAPWLDVMAGSATTPLGTVTLFDSINPARFLRFDLDTMTDQGAYWDLAVTFIESSHDSPFVDGEAVVVSFIPGVAAAGATVPLGSISPQPAETFIGNFTAGVAAPTARAGSLIAGAGLTYTAGGTLAVGSSTSVVVGADDVQRAALTGAIAASQNSNATVFSGIKDNDVAENDRTNLNYVSSTSCIAVVTDDSANDELEVTYQRAALTGAIAASQNSNITLFSGILDNAGSTTDRGNLNFAPSTSNTWSVVDALPINAISLSVQRAALTGAIAASANSNATVFAGIRDNGSAENDRTNLNFVSGASTTSSVTDDSGNDELEAKVDYVGTASVVALTGVTGAQGVIDISALECGGAVTIQSTGDFSIDGFTAKSDGYWFDLVRRDANSNLGSLLDNIGATTTSVRTPSNTTHVFALGAVIRCRYQASRWRALPAVAGTSALIARTVYTSGSGTHTYDARTRRVVVRMKGGGGSGGGTISSGLASGSAAGGGGGAGADLCLDITSVPTSSAYSVGAGGAGVVASGASGSSTTFHDGSATRTAAGGSNGAPSLTTTVSNTAVGGGGGTLPSSAGAAWRGAGSPGAPGYSFSLDGANFGNGGNGGVGFEGSGAGYGRTSALGDGNGSNGQGPGAGGGGAYADATTTEFKGGDGVDGIVDVYEFD